MAPRKHFCASFVALLLALCIPAITGYISENIKGFINDPDGLSLIASNGKYLSMIDRGEANYVEAIKTEKDQYTRFVLRLSFDKKGIYVQCHPDDYFWHTVLRNGRLALECAYHRNGQGLSRVNEFDTFSVGDGSQIGIKSRYNDQFLRRWLSSNIQFVRPMSTYIQTHSTFTIESAARMQPEFELLSVTFGDAKGRLPAPPVVAKMSRYENRGASSISHTFKFEHAITQSQTTSWEHHFGTTLTAEFKYSMNYFNLAQAEMSLGITLSYDYKQGGSSTVEKADTITEFFQVDIQPNSCATAQLMIYQSNDVEVPFEAKIKKTSFNDAFEKVETVLTERGTWRGVMLLESDIKVKTEDL